MKLEDAVRDLIAQELSKDEKAKLPPISRRTGVSCKKLWYFFKRGKKLSAEDAQTIYETLSGQPLLPSDDV